METPESIRASLIPEEWVSSIDLSVATFTSHPPKPKEAPDTVLRLHNKSGEVQTQTYSGVSIHGLRIPPRFSPCKTYSERWLNLQDLTCFDFKMFDVANLVANLNGEDGPGGTPSHETLSVSPQGALEFFLSHWTASFRGQRPFQVTWSSGKVQQM